VFPFLTFLALLAVQRNHQTRTIFVSPLPPPLPPTGTGQAIEIALQFLGIGYCYLYTFFKIRKAFFDGKSNESAGLTVLWRDLLKLLKSWFLEISNNFSGLFRREETTLYLSVNIFI